MAGAFDAIARHSRMIGKVRCSGNGDLWQFWRRRLNDHGSGNSRMRVEGFWSVESV